MRWRLVLLLASLLVVSIVAGCYYYGSTSQSPSPSVRAESSITNLTPGYEIIVGEALTYSVELSAGQSPTGTITFKLYGPDATPNDYTDNCGGTPLFTDTANVDSGNYNYDSDDFTPTSVGTYYWSASYSGDSNNQAATGSCSSVMEVVKLPPPETTQEETTSILEEGELASPPDSTLSYGGREVRVSVSASYCWSSTGGSMCADGVATLPPRKQTLHVPSGSEMVFRYEAPRPPKEVRVSARSFDDANPRN